MEKLNLEILSVNYNGVEFRCEQYLVKNFDVHYAEFLATRRSPWYSKDGTELDDQTAVKLLSEQKADKAKNEADKAKNELIRKLWNRDDG